MMVKKIPILIFSIFIFSIGSYFLIQFYDDEVVKIRFERHGAYGYEVMMVLEKSGKLDVYVSGNYVGSSDVNKWTQVQATHKRTTITSEQQKVIEGLAREAFWKEWFFYDGHTVRDDIEGYWYRIVHIHGKKYEFYNYPYSNNSLNRLIASVAKLSPIEIQFDDIANIISVGGDLQ